MPVVENSSRRMVLSSGKTSLTLDKDADKATLERKLLFWKLSPLEAPLSDITEVNIDKLVDRASGTEMYAIVMVTRDGAGWSLSADDAVHADTDAAAVRGFLGLSPMA